MDDGLIQTKSTGSDVGYAEILERFEGRFEFLLNAVSVSLWDWDLSTGRILVTSGERCLLGDNCLGVERDREGWMDVVHPDDRAEVKSSLDACLSGKTEKWQCEHRFLTTKGAWLWVENQGVVVRRGPDGEVIEMMGTVRDVQKPKTAMLDLEKQLEMSHAAGEIAKFGFWEYDVSNDLVTWSKMTRQILEVDDDFVPSAEATFDMMSPNDADCLREALDRAISQGEPYDLVFSFVTAKGRRILARTAAKPLHDKNGELIRVLGVFQDVTESTMMKHELEAFFHHSPDFQATTNFEGVLQTYNATWPQKFGYSDSELSVMPLGQLIAPEEREEFNKVLESVSNGARVTNYETRVILNNSQSEADMDEDAWLSWSLSSDRELKLIFVSARCITEQKRMLQHLKEERLRAEEASGAKSDFLSVMSHELRTPLNPILGFADMLLADLKSPEQKEIVQTIVDSAEQMVDLVNQILDYGKLEAGRVVVENVDFSLKDLVGVKVKLMQSMAEGRRIHLNHSIKWGSLDLTRLPVMRGDEDKISLILRKLLSNAIKFTKEGQVSLDINIADASDGHALLEIKVSDTGVGMSPEDKQKLFQPFSQVDSSATREHGGTGVGLSICKHLVDLLDGTIHVESEINKGTCFSVRLPLEYYYSTEPDPNMLEEDLNEVDPAFEKRPEVSGHVLVVEDNKSNAFYVEKLLAIPGVSVVVVFDGEAALKQLSDQRFDLVILDLHMPGIGGIETLKRIRAMDTENVSPNPLPVYVLTADVSNEAFEKSSRYGADGFLTKPVSPKAMWDLLAKHLHHS